ncbi:Calreticulin family-domain-containing protein [Lipomyces japonicus]|uniref:Calreticulin family-domain-containing protein n=1 Tax=Lipomyces japonicus TaxID=56871 RepID=UPI0034CDCD7A
MRGLTSYSLYLLAVTLAAAGARAQEEAEFDEFVSQPEVTEVTEIAHPTFSPYAGSTESAVLFEQFIGDLNDRWNPSSAKKDTEDGSEALSYVGHWAVEEPTVFPAFSGDKGLVVKDRAAHHAISAKFDAPLDNTEKTLVLQYEVKLQNGLECGGAYLKLLTEDSSLHAEEFSDKTGYQIMFGPDKCGSTNKVHFIVRRKSPVTGEYEEKHLIGGPHAIINKLSNLYTLIVKPDSTFEVRINGDIKKAGSFFDELNFQPSFNPPKEIEDAEDVKPEDWVDDELIPDPSQAIKPEDWDDDAPYQIPDPEAVKPEDWEEKTSEFIEDPESSKPDDWDDEEDGEWTAPLIPNPECEEHGCGPWSPPSIRNPDFKGKWVQPTIANPDYKGPWYPRKIANPDYYEDSTVSNLEPIGAVGFELWTMQNNILFDNIYIGHSVEEAEAIGNATFIAKYEIESLEEEATRPSVDSPSTEPSLWDLFKADPVNFVTEQLTIFFTLFPRDPVYTIRAYPETAVALGVVGVTALAIFFGTISAFFGSKSGAAVSSSGTSAEAKVDSAEGSSTGTEASAAKKRSKKN